MNSLEGLSILTQRLLNSLAAELESRNPIVRVSLTMQRRRAAEECQTLLLNIRGQTPVPPPDLADEVDAFRYHCEYVREGVVLLIRELGESGHSTEFIAQVVSEALIEAPDLFVKKERKKK